MVAQPVIIPGAAAVCCCRPIELTADLSERSAVVNGRSPGVPGSEVSGSDLLQRHLLQVGVGEQPLQRGVLCSSSFSFLASSACSPPNWFRHR
jgi:hypothetical protein